MNIKIVSFCFIIEENVFGGMLNILVNVHYLRSLFLTKDIKRTLSEIVRIFNLHLLFSLLLYCV